MQRLRYHNHSLISECPPQLCPLQSQIKVSLLIGIPIVLGKDKVILKKKLPLKQFDFLILFHHARTSSYTVPARTYVNTRPTESRSASYHSSYPTSSSRPITISSRPIPCYDQPVMSSSQPETSLSRPITSPSRPITSYTRPITSSSRPITSSSQPVTSSTRVVSSTTLTGARNVSSADGNARLVNTSQEKVNSRTQRKLRQYDAFRYRSIFLAQKFTKIFLNLNHLSSFWYRTKNLRYFQTNWSIQQKKKYKR